jgi:hypothetical protein
MWVSRNTTWRWIQFQAFPVYKTPLGMWLTSPSLIDLWILACRRVAYGLPPTPELEEHRTWRLDTSEQCRADTQACGRVSLGAASVPCARSPDRSRWGGRTGRFCKGAVAGGLRRGVCPMVGSGTRERMALSPASTPRMVRPLSPVRIAAARSRSLASPHTLTGLTRRWAVPWDPGRRRNPVVFLPRQPASLRILAVSPSPPSSGVSVSSWVNPHSDRLFAQPVAQRRPWESAGCRGTPAVAAVPLARAHLAGGRHVGGISRPSWPTRLLLGARRRRAARASGSARPQ